MGPGSLIVFGILAALALVPVAWLLRWAAYVRRRRQWWLDNPHEGEKRRTSCVQ